MWSSKPKAKVFSGFMGDTSPEQEECLAQFRSWIQENNTNPDNQWDDYDFLRFCRARKFVLADVQLMWTNFINWRKEKNVVELYKTWSFEEKDKVFEIYPQFYHKVDKLMRPIYIERLGQLNVNKLWEVTSEERMWNNYIFSFE